MLGADNQQERLPENVENLKWYLTGFIDGEGCFSIAIRKSKFSRIGWTMNPLFQVYQHKDNDHVLYVCKDVIGCGYISHKGGNPLCTTYCVDRTSDLTDKVIPFFDKYFLLGEKYNNFLLFKEIVIGVAKKEHLDSKGFLHLAKLAFQMNKHGMHRKITLVEIQNSLTKSSETIRQTS